MDCARDDLSHWREEARQHRLLAAATRYLWQLDPNDGGAFAAVAGIAAVGTSLDVARRSLKSADVA